MSSETKQKEEKDGTRNYEQKTGVLVDKCKQAVIWWKYSWLE